MKLRDIVQRIETFDEEASIFAACPWTADSEAMVALEPDSGGLPAEAKEAGLEYFRAVSVVKNFLEGWYEVGNPTLDETIERVIKFAEYDA